MADTTDSLRRSVQDYYGSVLTSSEDLQTSACCVAEAPPARVLEALRLVHPEVTARFYGCGSPIPPALDRATVVDLGCGTGRDSYVIAQLVGPEGRVVGIDMTAEQLAVARSHSDWHAERFGFANVEFRDGFIEDLAAAGIEDASVDVVVSNCVLNLATDKQRVFEEILRVLKPGGELFFSDVFADRRIPPHLSDDPVLRGECLGGALYGEDFRRMLARVGCHDARVVSSRPLSIDNPALELQIGSVGFTSRTVRAFKLDLEDRCEDFGQVAWYLGSIPEMPHRFELDDHHTLETGRPMLVCGNTADMLSLTRYAPHFRVEGDKRTHHGLFDCGPGPATSASSAASAGGPCC
ncbi:MAG TPA: methyltransferase domain-containing protein [Acidimicrobiales bacterium]|nr:methyltransferase domain-containing protein [Acidimicrobiales bacterium]